ncbi:DUF5134 domain-containing protein [Actinacidiphila acididurans]|uniref:DUF5134 domain-containing protein n=1 Tax=Actinacidiphila acididurans TaxID=2784346 RepID=A0ABS2TVY3_9ACTN|nr:DUF5134 domain-containing protein [Actinacidiphila acididurans]MBM9507497.1 DUF5134 domain-containing protein [Actinacidiphila acididurans]
MHGPPLVAWLLVVLSAAAATTCLVRRESTDEALMGTGMAVMAVPLSVFDPWPWCAPVFTAVFALAGARSLWAARGRGGHHLHHSVCSAAMVYVALSMARPGAAHSAHAEHAGHAAPGVPLLTGLLLLYFAGYVLRAGMLLVAAPAHRHALSLIPAGAGAGVRADGVSARYAPEVAIACRVTMALGMLAMLLAM